MRHNPHLYEINACLYLRRMSGKYHRPMTLADIPEEEWQYLSGLGIDLLWLMGAWQRSPASRQIALHESSLRLEYERALPDWSAADVSGSPYAIPAYSLEPALGKAGDLARLKKRLNRHGLGLVLDFVPNHLATDHPWTSAHPDWFVQGSNADARNHPERFFSTDTGAIIAHGRDPNFPPWTDTAQMNLFSPPLRQALTRELLRISELADGVRCDMAMLALNDVFGNTWRGEITGYPRPEAEFWGEAIRQVRQRQPDFLFLAEVYWGLEERLRELGIDFTYNKELYDGLRYASPEEIRGYLKSNTGQLAHSAHFIENHDEPRAVSALGRERSKAAAIIIGTLPGLRMFHDGQFTGRSIRLPVQLAREPAETLDLAIAQFYEKLLTICNSPVFHDGSWQLLEAEPAWEGNQSQHNLLSWTWCNRGETRIVVINYSPHPAQGRLKMPLSQASTQKLTFLDELTGTAYIREPAEVSGQGLYVALEPYQAHLFSLAVS